MLNKCSCVTIASISGRTSHFTYGSGPGIDCLRMHELISPQYLGALDNIVYAQKTMTSQRTEVD